MASTIKVEEQEIKVEDIEVKVEDEASHSILNSNFPVYLPPCEALHLPESEFQMYVKLQLPPYGAYTGPSTGLPGQTRKTEPSVAELKSAAKPASSPFVDAMLQSSARDYSRTELEHDNRMLTENKDVAHISTQSAIVDLFFELENTISSAKLSAYLDAAWKEDELSTLKLIFNARSIHLGKSNRNITYRALGWVAEHHPLTFLANLRWLTRPVIQKKAAKVVDDKVADQNKASNIKKEHDDEDLVMVDVEEAMEGTKGEPVSPEKRHDVKYGVSHGYWKDLLNLLVLAAHDQLHAHGNPAAVLDTHPEKSRGAKRRRVWNPAAAKGVRDRVTREHHHRILAKLEEDALYRVLHLTVARLFAYQLKDDIQYLSSDKKSNLKKLSLAAKWAPSFSEFHDKHTFIVSSIAEILYPEAADICPDVPKDDRELYLRHAREHYRRLTISPLRKALAVVERDIVSGNFRNIKYECVPSLAMNRYQGLFVTKDEDRFLDYLDKVTVGTKKIAGAILLPSTLVHNVSWSWQHGRSRAIVDKKNPLTAAQALAKEKVLEGQWKTLIQRMRDSGTIQSSIAVCDVSGSMRSPVFEDGTIPMDSAIGLSLMLAEIVDPPFGGLFITFSENPVIIRAGGVQDERSFAEKVRDIRDSPWGTNTDFVAVFERLILPLATENRLKKEDMVKQIFVFSDMQFDQAESYGARWTTSFERIKHKFERAGYDMPKLIFWNLAGGRAGYGQYGFEAYEAETAPKPVTAEEQGVALVSGYSQGQMKMFLEGGQFEDVVEEEVVDEDMMEEEDKDGVEVQKTKKVKMDPLTIVKKAIGHPAYAMLEVVD